MLPAVSAEQPVFVLQTDRIDPACVDDVGGVSIVVATLLMDLRNHFGVVAVGAGLVIHGHDPNPRSRVTQGRVADFRYGGG